MRHSTALEKRVQRHKRGERMTMMLSSHVLRWLWLSHTLHFGHHTHCRKQKATNLGQITWTWPDWAAAWKRSNKVLYWWKLLKGRGLVKDTRNCQEKVKKISHLKTNQLAPSIYIMKELRSFSLDQWEISIHLLWGKCFNIPHHLWPSFKPNQT